ncbi:MAG: DNA recombination protein RmuC [Spirochaetales bacterium]|nr:DNA recombination protein RmuC [Spirochaetales bacterium]MCF7939166.1 DNA recombination protein RmuC [Spirochaetales bacterium]
MVEAVGISPLMIAGLTVGAAFVGALIAVFIMRRGSSGGDTAVMDAVTARMEEVRRLSSQVEELTDIFLVPRKRGGMGEVLLAELLKSWLPAAHFRLQHRFSDGSRVDAAVFLGSFIVPVDAKFPLEDSSSSAILKHAGSIADHYIRPSEGTLSFAVMYLPSERIYYEHFAEGEPETLARCLDLGVIPAGPSTLFLFLQTLAYGLQGFALSREQRRLRSLIAQLSKDFAGLKKLLSVSRTHLKNLNQSFQQLEDSAAGNEQDIHALEQLDRHESGSEGDKQAD